MTAHPGPLPVPARITLALDSAGLWGPQVDVDLGGVEPMVDEWEAGIRLPTPAQIDRLARLTGYPAAWFTTPVEDWETRPVRTFICERGRRPENRLTVVESHIDWDGVLWVEELTLPKPPYRPRTHQEPLMARQSTSATGGWQTPPRGAHLPTPADGTPHVCTCGLRTDLRSRYHLSAGDLPPAGEDARTRAAGDKQGDFDG